MKAGVVIFIVIICSIIIVELVSLVKKMIDNAKAKKQRLEKMKNACESVSTSEDNVSHVDTQENQDHTSSDGDNKE